MLHEGWDAASMLRNIEKKNEWYIYALWQFNVWCVGLETFGKRLTIDDIVIEDKVTQTRAWTRFNYANDKPKSSSKQCRCRYIYMWVMLIYFKILIIRMLYYLSIWDSFACIFFYLHL